MKKKLVSILIVMLFIFGVVVPVSSAFSKSPTFDYVKPEIVNDDRPKIEIFLPDVQIYMDRLPMVWGKVEFDEPGATIDIDLSNVESNVVLLRFSQRVICHVDGHIIPIMVISSISRPQSTESHSIRFIGRDENWENTISHAYFSTDKAEDEILPLKVGVTGVPWLYRIPVFLYYQVVFTFFIDSVEIPSQIEKTYGATTEYQLHVHS